MKKLLLFIVTLFCISGMLQAQVSCGFDQAKNNEQARNPSYSRNIKHVDELIKNAIQLRDQNRSVNDTFYIPIVVHVMHNGGALGAYDNPTDATIISTIDYLNKVYNGTWNGTGGSIIGVGDINIKFVLATKDTNNNVTTGIERINCSGLTNYGTYGLMLDGLYGVDQFTIKNKTRWDPFKYYNIWVVNKIDGCGGVPNNCSSWTGGFAYFPFEPVFSDGVSGSDFRDIDGTIMLATGMVSGNSILPHEIGHALNLYHPFEGSNLTTNACPSTDPTQGDFCADTDPINNPQGLGYAYPGYARDSFPYTAPFTNICSGTPYTSNTEKNFMNYTFKTRLFTANQKQRMKASCMSTIREGLTTSWANNRGVYPTTWVAPIAASATPVTSATGLGNIYAGIYRVELNDMIVNSMLTSQEGGYVNKANKWYDLFLVNAGVTYTMKVNILNGNSNQLGVYIDYNNDGIFNSTTEKVYLNTNVSRTAAVGYTLQVPITFTVPASTAMSTGSIVRMRVINDLSSAPAISGTSTSVTYGQAEDYPIYLAAEPCYAPSAPTASGVSICSGNTASLTATGTGTGTIRWYSASTAGTLLSTGANYTTPTLTTSTTYYAQDSTCTKSPTRTAVLVTVNALPVLAANSGGATSVCANASTPAFTNAQSGGTWSIIAGTGTASVTTGGVVTGLTAGTVSVKYTYSNGTCSNSVSSSLTVKASPSSPTAGNASRCGTGTVAITATPTVGDAINWYSASSSGTMLQLNNTSYTTPSISITTTYYATDSNKTTGCVSTRTSVIATVNTIPSSPTAGSASRCGTGSVAITATPTAGDGINWYSASTSGTMLQLNNTNYTTPSISTTTTYYALDSNTSTGCVSSSRTAVIATVNAIPSAPTAGNASRCGTGTVTITATPTVGDGINWYSASSIGTMLQFNNTSYTTPSISTTTTYYATDSNKTTGCVSTRTAVIATVNASPSSPTAGNASRCGTGTLTITATPTVGDGINWYSASSSGTMLQFNNTSYTTPSISTTTTYYATDSNKTTGCVSARTSVIATVNAIPSSPTAGNASRCGTGTVTITATPTFGDRINWYSASSSGTMLQLNNSNYTSPSISTTTTYYALDSNISTGCVSSSRTAVIATVNSIPSSPLAGNASRCGAGTLTITATPTAGDGINWYSASSSGTMLQLNNTSFNTPSISITTTYYATDSNTSTGCVSSSRTAVIATINALPVLSPNGGGASSVNINVSTPAFTNTQAGGTWSIVAGTGTASVTNGGVVTGLSEGTVFVKYTYSNGTCSNSVSSLLNVNTDADTTFATSCGMYNWPLNGSDYMTSGTYSFTENGQIHVLRLTVSEIVNPTIQTDHTNICAGSSTTLYAGGLPLDNLGNASLAVGLRKLKSVYTGPALRLRRSTDNQEQDFGFVGVDLDVDAVNAWLQGADGFCTTLYDQSNNGGDVRQSNVSAQPKFIASGINNKPMLHFNTSMSMYNEVNYSTPYSVIYGSRVTGASNRLLCSNSNNWLLGNFGGIENRAYFEGWVSIGTQPTTINQLYIYAATGTGSLSTVYNDGVEISSNDYGLEGPNGIHLNGSGIWGDNSDCDFTDVMIFGTALSNQNIVHLNKSIKDYYTTNTIRNYLWSPGGETTPSINVSTGGNYSVTVTNSDGCSSSSAVTTVSVNQATQALIIPSGSTSLCQGNTMNLSTIFGANNNAYVSADSAYASSVISVSSEYDHCPNAWAACQMLGTPNAYPNYGDIVTSWANNSIDRDFIELGFNHSSPINYIDIYETYNPGFVDTVYVKNPNTGLFEVVYTGAVGLAGNQSRIMHITFPTTSFNVSEIRIAINVNGLNNYYEIDAVKIGMINAINSYQYLWTPGGETTPSINVSTGGNYSVTVTNSNGCSATSEVTTVTLNELLSPTNGIDALVCENSSAVISATPPANCTIDWYGTGNDFTTIYSNDFNSSELNGANISGDASIIDNSLVLTQNVYAQLGGFTIPASGINASEYKMSFKMTNGGNGGADGMSYSFADDASASATEPPAENGTGTKLAICFDDWTCCDNTSALPGIKILYNSNVNTELSSIIGENGLLGYSDNTSWIGQSDVPVNVTIGETGLLNLTINGQVIFTNLQLPADYVLADKSSWVHVFKSRTGGAYMLHAIDDISIEAKVNSLLASGTSTFTTPSISSNTTYYAVSRDINTGCVSNTRLPVLVTVSKIQAPIVRSENTNLCAGTSTILNADIHPLNQVGNATLAIGLRKLKTEYEGPALRLRRSSDDEEQDFGFVGDDLDVNAVNAWLNGADGFCSILYDQSGNGGDVMQTSVSQQPIFIASGINNKPILHFNTSMSMYNEVNYSTPYSVIYGSRVTGASNRVLSSNNNNWLLGNYGGTENRAYFEGWVALSNQPTSMNQFYIYAATGTGSLSTVYNNGVEIISNDYGLEGPNGIHLNGSGVWGENSDCDFTDVMIFGTALSSQNIGQLNKSIHDYYEISNNSSSQLSYLWSPGGETTPSINVSTAGDYSVTVTNSNGCSATSEVTTVNLNQPTSDTTFAISCGMYIWENGNHSDYMSSGTYSYTEGCVTHVLKLTMNEPTTDTTRALICDGGMYIWPKNGSDYFSEGTYSYTDNCVTNILILKTAQSTSSSTNYAACASAMPYNWNGTAYSTAGTYLKHLTNVSGCDSAATLILTVSTVTPGAPTTVTQTLVSNECGARVYRYKVKKVTNATGYSWVLPSSVGGVDGVTLDSGDVARDSVIKVRYTSNAAAIVGDSIKVKAWSGCGNSVSKSIKLSNAALTVPVAPTAVTATKMVTGDCFNRTVRYSVPELPAGTATTAAGLYYEWSFTGTGSHGLTPWGTNNYVIDSMDVNGLERSRSIVVRYNAYNISTPSTTDSVLCRYVSCAGASGTVKVKVPLTALAVPVAPTAVTATKMVTGDCYNKTVRYSVPELPAGTATNAAGLYYEWSFTGTGSHGLTPWGTNNYVIDSMDVNGLERSRSIVVRYNAYNISIPSTTDSVLCRYVSCAGASGTVKVKVPLTALAVPVAPTAVTATKMITGDCYNKTVRYSVPELPAGTATNAAGLYYEWSFTGTGSHEGTLGGNYVIDSMNVNGLQYSRSIVVLYNRYNQSIPSTTDSVLCRYVSCAGASGTVKVKVPLTALTVPVAPTAVTATKMITGDCYNKTVRYSVPELPAGTATNAAGLYYEWSFTGTGSHEGTLGGNYVIDSMNVNGLQYSRSIVVLYNRYNQSIPSTTDSVLFRYVSCAGASGTVKVKVPLTALAVPVAPTAVTATKMITGDCYNKTVRYSVPELPAGTATNAAGLYYEWSFTGTGSHEGTLGGNYVIDSMNVNGLQYSRSIVVLYNRYNQSIPSTTDSVLCRYVSCAGASGTVKVKVPLTALAVPVAPTAVTATKMITGDCYNKTVRYSVPELPAGTATNAAGLYYEWSFTGTGSHEGTLGGNYVIDSMNVNGLQYSRSIVVLYNRYNQSIPSTTDSVLCRYVSCSGASGTAKVKVPLTALTVPVAPTAVTATKMITGDCYNKTVRYSVPELPAGTATNAAGLYYEWSFTGTGSHEGALGGNYVIDSMNVNGLQFSRSIVVRYNTNFQSIPSITDSVICRYWSCAGPSGIAKVKVPLTVLSVPAAPKAVTATKMVTNVCNGRTVRYSVPELPVGTSTNAAGLYYDWSFTGTGSHAPFSWRIDSMDVNGLQYSKSIVVYYATSAAALSSDSVLCRYISCAGPSGIAKVKVPLSLFAAPAAPSAITATKLINTECGPRRVRYSVPPLPLATATAGAADFYAWSFTGTGLHAEGYPGVNFVIDSMDVNGLYSSRSIIISYTSDVAASSNDSVLCQYISKCGYSIAAKVSVPLTTAAPLPLAAPSSLTGIVNICNAVATSTPVTYTTTAVTGAISYAWTLPYGAYIDSGSNGLKIRVVFTTTTGNDVIYVQARNTLGCLSETRGLNLATANCLYSKISSINTQALAPTESMDVSVYPNPTSNSFKLVLKKEKVNLLTRKTSIAKARVFDIQGRLVKSFTFSSDKIISFGDELKSGVYMVEVREGDKVKTVRVVKY